MAKFPEIEITDQADEDRALMVLVAELIKLKEETGIDHYGDLMAEHGTAIMEAEARHAKRMGW